ncbi:MAG: ABC transporter permease, partial [Bacteroidales bacterium]|nr:ABC transporter permease [Bacteroidales bacterium]
MDFWSEIFMALRRNKLRTILTGFAISWGIFMLIILLSVGNGLKNGVNTNFADRAKNTYTIWSSSTELPYKGHKANRWITLSDKDIEYLENHLYHVDEVSPVFSKGGTLIFSDKSKSVQVDGVRPIFKNIQGIKIVEGRFINDNDMKIKEKVVVIDKNTADEIRNKISPPEEKKTNRKHFKSPEETVSILGEFVNINGINYVIAGIFESDMMWGGTGQCYVPFSTLQQIYNVNNEYYKLSFTTFGLDTKEDNENFRKELKRNMALLHEFSPDDQRGVWIDSQMLNALETNKIFNTINIFIWIIGIAMLISGIVGVTNIMRITVKERTFEIGIRKALGAKPRSILMSIVMEALIITTVFGYVGMFVGMGLMEIVNKIMETVNAGKGANEAAVFLNLSVDIKIVLMATLVLIISGVIAGLAPAWKAVSVKPVEAMS